MERAVELARRCVTESGRAPPSPKVGAVGLSANGEPLGEAHRGELNNGDHAEYCLIKELEDAQLLRGRTVFTMLALEPCTTLH